LFMARAVDFPVPLRAHTVCSLFWFDAFPHAPSLSKLRNSPSSWFLFKEVYG
jgi:hypothetical protein